MNTKLLAPIVLMCCGTVVAQDVEKRTDDILSSSGRADGLCVLVQVPDSELAIALARKSRRPAHDAKPGIRREFGGQKGTLAFLRMTRQLSQHWRRK